MTDHLTDASVKELLDGATPGPWRADGEPWNRVVWSSAENRVCFMAHSSGLNDERDIATSNLAAAAPELARALLAARADAKAAVAVVVEKAAERIDLAEHDAEERDWRSGANAFAPEDAIAEVAEWKRLAIAGNLIALEMRNIEAERDRLAAANAREAGLRKALEVIREWTAFPPSGRFWRNGDGTISARPMPYGAAFGSNGERDFMRQVARAALAQPSTEGQE